MDWQAFTCARVGLRSFAVVILVATAGWAQSGPAAGGVRLAEEQYRNIQVLKGIPADQIPASMQLIATSLGVQCAYCHVQGANDKDDKETKIRAREMISMVLDVNKNHFGGRVAVSCNTCHRGATGPVNVPALVTDERPARAMTAEESQAPTPEQLLDKYIAALGGEANLAKLTSRVAKGTSQSPASNPYPVEIVYKAPDNGLTVTNISGSNSSAGFSGTAGWTMDSTRGLRDMSSADFQGAQLKNDLFLARNVRKLYTQWRLGRPDRVGGRDAYVLNGTAPGRKPVRLYLDQQNGMLLRMMHFTETPVGRVPTVVDYSDYRAVDGVQVPFRISIVKTNSRPTMQLEQVTHNTAVDDARFAKPAPPPQR